MYYIMVYWISKQIPRAHSGEKQLQLQSNGHIFLKIGRVWQNCNSCIRNAKEGKQDNSQVHFMDPLWELWFLSHYNHKSLHFNAHCNTLPIKGSERKKERKKETNAFFSEAYLLLMHLVQLPTEIIWNLQADGDFVLPRVSLYWEDLLLW